MKNEKALDIMEHIDSDIIDEADACMGAKKKTVWVRYGAMAACLCLAVAGAFGVSGLFRNGNITADDPAGNNDAISDTQVQKPAGAGLYVPAVELPDTTDGATSDMIGLVVYNGGIYTQAECYYGDEAREIDKLTGKYLGYATGSIDEWSTQEAYADEFASSIPGKVYEVVGYDPGFRICIRSEADAEDELFIQFLDRLNGITLTTGADLFENRLRLRGRVAGIRWQNGDCGNIWDAVLDDGVWENFLGQLDKGTFVNTWDPGNPGTTVYDTPKQAHIILTMEDGTTIRLRLIEGGYVGYDALGWYFVRIPGDAFDAVFAACGGNG